MANQYPFGSNVEVQYSDFAVSSVNPGIEFGGTEAGAIWFEDREINGVMYRVQNATWNKFAQVWSLVDATKPAYALSLQATVLQWLSSPAGITPFATWSPSGTVAGNRAGLIPSVAADGSVGTPTTFSSPFLSDITSVVVSVRNNYPSNPVVLSAQVVPSSVSLTGFTVYVAGGAPGTTVSVDYVAFGS